MGNFSYLAQSGKISRAPLSSWVLPAVVTLWQKSTSGPKMTQHISYPDVQKVEFCHNVYVVETVERKKEKCCAAASSVVLSSSRSVFFFLSFLSKQATLVTLHDWYSGHMKSESAVPHPPFSHHYFFRVVNPLTNVIHYSLSFFSFRLLRRRLPPPRTRPPRPRLRDWPRKTFQD